jgi:hypothetical protein
VTSTPTITKNFRLTLEMRQLRATASSSRTCIKTGIRNSLNGRRVRTQPTDRRTAIITDDEKPS